MIYHILYIPVIYRLNMDGQKTNPRTTTLEVLMWRIKTTQEQIEKDKKYLKELETAYDAVLNEQPPFSRLRRSGLE